MSDDKFPKDFLWGASTASHQVEGNTHNQWSEWELNRAERLAATASKRLNWLPRWRDFAASAEDPQNYISGTGVDHYNLYREDFRLLQELHMNAFRFGIEWSRIEPEEGKWDDKEIEHYRQYIQALIDHHIEPILNVWHWTMPVWFCKKGGFEKRKNLIYFERFVKKIGKEFGASLHYVLVLNEPSSYVTFGYLLGQWPPERKNPLISLRVYYNLGLAHKRAYNILKRQHPTLQVGTATLLVHFRSKKGHTWLTRWIVGYIGNWWFLNRIRKYQDFVGLNYYFTQYVGLFGTNKNPKGPTNDLGWYMEPSGIYPLLKKVWKRYKKPIIITENGVADEDDKYREWWLKQTIEAMRHAVRDGVQLKGYLHWTLTDNFEWAFGWWPKFGLAKVDPKTKKRTLKPSAKWFAEEIRYL